ESVIRRKSPDSRPAFRALGEMRRRGAPCARDQRAVPAVQSLHGPWPDATLESIAATRKYTVDAGGAPARAYFAFVPRTICEYVAGFAASLACWMTNPRRAFPRVHWNITVPEIAPGVLVMPTGACTAPLNECWRTSKPNACTRSLEPSQKIATRAVSCCI